MKWAKTIEQLAIDLFCSRTRAAISWGNISKNDALRYDWWKKSGDHQLIIPSFKGFDTCQVVIAGCLNHQQSVCVRTFERKRHQQLQHLSTIRFIKPSEAVNNGQLLGVQLLCIYYIIHIIHMLTVMFICPKDISLPASHVLKKWTVCAKSSA